jgi:mono/diheme cytochrome c family protein
MKHSAHITFLTLLPVFLIVFLALSQTGKLPQKTNELTDLGKKSYEQHCAVCHGLKGNADTPAGKAVTPPTPDLTKALKEWPDSKGDPAKIFEIITKGIPDSAMAAWGNLPENERWGLVYYVLEFSKLKETLL